MKKVIIIVGTLLATIFLYLVGEQVYIYYKHDKQNVWFLFRNYSEKETVHLEMLIDDNVFYDVDATNDHLPMAYIKMSKAPLGIHSMEIKIDGQSLYKGKIKMLLNRYIIAEYAGDEVPYEGVSTLGVWTSPRFIRDL